LSTARILHPFTGPAKGEIASLSSAPGRLLALRGVSFEFMDPETIHQLPGERMGLIAQEVGKASPIGSRPASNRS